MTNRPQEEAPADVLLYDHEHTTDVFTVFGISTVATFLGAMVCYAEPFRFFEFALSDLGMTRTVNGYPNGLSLACFAVGMCVSAVCMIVLSVRYLKRLMPAASAPRSKGFLAVGAAVGYLVSIFPHDLFHGIHTAGAAVMVFSLWALAVCYLRDEWRLGRPIRAIIGHLALQSSVVAYAVMYVFEVPGKQTAQKIAVLGLIVVLAYASRLTTSRALLPAESRTDVPATRSAYRSSYVSE